MKLKYLIVIFFVFGCVLNLQAGIIDVALDGASSSHAFARADLVEWGITETEDGYGGISATASALAMYGYFDEFNTWIYFDKFTDVQVDIDVTNNSIFSTGSLTYSGTGPGMSDGWIDNSWYGTLTIGTSETHPLGTEGLTLQISADNSMGQLQLEIDSINIPSNTEIEVFAGQVLIIDFLHYAPLSEGETYSSTGVSFVVVPEPGTLSMLCLGGLALMRRRRG